MIKIISIPGTIILAAALLLNTGCVDDVNTDNKLAPQLTILEEPSAEVVVGQDANVTLKVEASRGSSDLNGLWVYENGVKIDYQRLSIDGSPASANPVLIVNPSEAMSWEISINVQDAYDARTYAIKVDDKNGLADEVEFDIKVEEPLETSITGVLWNQAGPAGRGALDLDEGLSTGIATNGETTPDQAEIRDCGIDSTSMTLQFWRKQIAHLNGTALRYVGTSVGDATFDDILSKEAVSTAFDNADAVSASPVTADGNPTWGSYQVSNVVKEGDIFAVKKTGRIYLIHIDKIVETGADNQDNYAISIKY
jgi:hypothetical protein